MDYNSKINNYVEEIFKPYENTTGVNELKEELITNLNDKFNDLVSGGITQEDAYSRTVDSLGDISELIESISDKTKELRGRVTWNLSHSALDESKLDSVDLKSGVFNYSSLSKSDFHNSDLSGSSFKSSDLKKSDFSNANLTGSSFKSCELGNCNFKGADLSSCQIIKSNLKGAAFDQAVLNNTEFKYSDLNDISFENMKLTAVSFDYSSLKNTSFRNSVLLNVSFKTDVKKTVFYGASMDKVTYALLKGYKADLRNVTLI